jgi:peptidoglycan hydrolase-like protein with peptidoglycan-binding domain
VITAKDSLGKTVTASHGFKVSASGSTTKTLGFATTGSNVSTGTTAKTTTKTTTAKTTVSVKKTYSGTFPKLHSRGYFKKGDKGTQVERLQKFLNWFGDYKLDPDGIFGNKTLAAVMDFQKKNNLDIDGLFGKESLKKAKSIKK